MTVSTGETIQSTSSRLTQGAVELLFTFLLFVIVHDDRPANHGMPKITPSLYWVVQYREYLIAASLGAGLTLTLGGSRPLPARTLIQIALLFLLQGLIALGLVAREGIDARIMKPVLGLAFALFVSRATLQTTPARALEATQRIAYSLGLMLLLAASIQVMTEPSALGREIERIGRGRLYMTTSNPNVAGIACASIGSIALVSMHHCASVSRWTGHLAVATIALMLTWWSGCRTGLVVAAISWGASRLRPSFAGLSLLIVSFSAAAGAITMLGTPGRESLLEDSRTVSWARLLEVIAADPILGASSSTEGLITQNSYLGAWVLGGIAAGALALCLLCFHVIELRRWIWVVAESRRRQPAPAHLALVGQLGFIASTLSEDTLIGTVSLPLAVGIAATALARDGLTSIGPIRRIGARSTPAPA